MRRRLPVLHIPWTATLRSESAHSCTARRKNALSSTWVSCLLRCVLATNCWIPQQISALIWKRYTLSCPFSLQLVVFTRSNVSWRCFPFKFNPQPSSCLLHNWHGLFSCPIFPLLPCIDFLILRLLLKVHSKLLTGRSHALHLLTVFVSKERRQAEVGHMHIRRVLLPAPTFRLLLQQPRLCWERTRWFLSTSLHSKKMRFYIHEVVLQVTASRVGNKVLECFSVHYVTDILQLQASPNFFI